MSEKSQHGAFQLLLKFAREHEILRELKENGEEVDEDRSNADN